MIERKIVDENLQQYLVQQFVTETLNRVGHSHTLIQKTPLGEKIIIHATRPGLIVGAKGANIKKLTKVLKTKFKLENPQIEIIEIKDGAVNANLVAENIAAQLEKFGSARFKAIGYAAMEAAIKHGALGIEIIISGKIPSSRAKAWRFYLGYLKKCGDLAVSAVKTSYAQALLKSGIVGIQVRIMPGDVKLPDRIQLVSELQSQVQDMDSKVVEPVDEATKAQAQELTATSAGEAKNKEVAKKSEKTARAEKSARTDKSAPKKPRAPRAPKAKKPESVPAQTTPATSTTQ